VGDLKTNWGNPPLGDLSDMGGALPTSRGTDPLINTSGSSGLTGVSFGQAVVPVPGGEETANSLSGLPLQPQRFQPSETPPAPPTLQQRNPGTIDQR
jgi:hypothetical protein